MIFRYNKYYRDIIFRYNKYHRDIIFIVFIIKIVDVN